MPNSGKVKHPKNEGQKLEKSMGKQASHQQPSNAKNVTIPDGAKTVDDPKVSHLKNVHAFKQSGQSKNHDTNVSGKNHSHDKSIAQATKSAFSSSGHHCASNSGHQITNNIKPGTSSSQLAASSVDDDKSKIDRKSKKDVKKSIDGCHGGRKSIKSEKEQVLTMVDNKAGIGSKGQESATVVLVNENFEKHGQLSVAAVETDDKKCDKVKGFQVRESYSKNIFQMLG